MKVMHFIHGLSTGGAETLVKNYMLNFDESSVDIILLCLNHYENSPYEEILANAGIRIIYVSDYLHYGKIINKIFRYLLVRKFIRMESPDILHTHLFVNRYVKFAKPDSSTRIFYTVHNEPKILWFGSSKKRKKDFEATKWLLRHYNFRFIVLHEKMKKEVEDIFGVSKAVVLNNGIDVLKFKNTKGKSRLRAELGIPEAAFVIGHVGRFAQQKNHEFLVNVFKKIKNPNKFLLMIGNGEDKTKIENILNRYNLNSKYLILSSRNDVPDLMSAMDVFVFPSKYEGLGIALIEAQEAKLPCFVSDAVPEYATISNLVTRLSLNEGAEKWAEVIGKYKKPENVVVDDENWDIKKITKQLEKIYEKALEEKKSGKK